MLGRNLLGNLGANLFRRGIVTTTQNTAKKASSPLAELRKKSGYSLSLCKKALASCNDDVTQAHQWLDERAQAEGWNKANKLEGRSTSNGLIGVQVDGKRGVILELNCETDFVAKNSKFMSLLNEVVTHNLTATKALSDMTESGIHMKKLDKQVIGEIEAKDGKTVADLIALNIGLIGENIAPGKAEHFAATSPDIYLIGYTHPPGGLHQGPLFYGRYGVLMVLEKKTNAKTFGGQSLESIGRQLCQHVVGMNPTSVGDLSNPDSWPAMSDDEVPKENKNEEETSEADFMGTSETEMIHQPFLLDTDRLVRDVLLEANLDIKYFARYEVGQNQ